MELRVHLVERNARRLVPRRCEHVLMFLAHVVDPAGRKPIARFEQRRRLDDPAKAIAFRTRRRVRNGRQKAPAMSRLALHGSDFAEPHQYLLHGGPRDVVAANEIAFRDVFRELPGAAVAGDRQKQPIGIGRPRLRRCLADRSRHVGNKIAAALTWSHQPAPRQMRKRRAHRRARHMQPRRERDFAESRPGFQPVRADDRENARLQLALQAGRRGSARQFFLFHDMTKYIRLRRLQPESRRRRWSNRSP